MTVLEILNEFPGETFIREHVNALKKFHPELKVHLGYTHTDGLGYLKSEIPSICIPNFDRLSNLKKIPFVLRYGKDQYRKKSVKAAVSQIKAERIHYHFSSSAIKWHPLLKSEAHSMSFSIRGTDIQVAPYMLKGRKDELRWISDEAVLIHAVCRDLKEELIQIHPDIDADKIKIIRTAIADFWFEKEISDLKTGEELQILSVGRLHWRKGFDDLIIAIKKLRDKGVSIKVNVIGEGEERSKLEYLIQYLGLNEIVELKGKMSQNKFLDLALKSDFVVQSSLMEGFPNSLAEMMALGIPIVSTNVNGVPEVLKKENAHEYTLCNAGDPDDLANALIKQIEKNKTYGNRFRSLREMAKQEFTAKLHANKFKDFLTNSY